MNQKWVVEITNTRGIANLIESGVIELMSKPNRSWNAYDKLNNYEKNLVFVSTAVPKLEYLSIEYVCILYKFLV